MKRYGGRPTVPGDREQLEASVLLRVRGEHHATTRRQQGKGEHVASRHERGAEPLRGTAAVDGHPVEFGHVVGVLVGDVHDARRVGRDPHRLDVSARDEARVQAHDRSTGRGHREELDDPVGQGVRAEHDPRSVRADAPGIELGRAARDHRPADLDRSRAAVDRDDEELRSAGNAVDGRVHDARRVARDLEAGDRGRGRAQEERGRAPVHRRDEQARLRRGDPPQEGDARAVRGDLELVRGYPQPRRRGTGQRHRRRRAVDGPRQQLVRPVVQPVGVEHHPLLVGRHEQAAHVGAVRGGEGRVEPDGLGRERCGQTETTQRQRARTKKLHRQPPIDDSLAEHRPCGVTGGGRVPCVRPTPRRSPDPRRRGSAAAPSTARWPRRGPASGPP